MTLAAPAQQDSSPRPDTGVERPPAPRRWRHRGVIAVAVCAIWIIGSLLWRGNDTLATPFAQLAGLHEWINHIRDLVQVAIGDNWFFHGVIGTLSDHVNSAVAEIGSWISHPATPRPVPQIGWLGVVAIVGWIALATAGWRIAILVSAVIVLCGMFGYWATSMDTVVVTVIAVVVCILVGVPIGIAMARRDAVSKLITPVLDLMQTMPAFTYLLPFFLIFSLGATCAMMLTIVYAMPPLIRITEHAIRQVSPTAIEAAESMGITRGQLLRKVQLPMARRTIVVGINQCTLAALSMVVIATFVGGPGLGQNVLQGLTTQNVGQAAVPGILLVLIAIAMDRATTAASRRSEGRAQATSGQRLVHRWVLAGGAVIAVIAVYLSRTYMSFARMPDAMNIGGTLTDGINAVTSASVDALSGVTRGLKNAVSYGFLNPLQRLLAETPFYLMAAVLLVLAFLAAGIRAALIAAVCECVVFAMGLWHDAMITLTMALVATVMVMVIALVVGVLLGRSRRADAIIRPILDAFQTIPSFVYLVPALAFFSASRFTAIVAAVAYSSPIAVKLVTDGIRGVPAPTVEASRSAGTTRWQEIVKVQLPMARSSLVLAANQGLLFVLSMVVIGGMVGGGSLGYLVVSGFSQSNLFGKGLAAGIAITALGIMLDRVNRGIAGRLGRPAGP